MCSWNQGKSLSRRLSCRTRESRHSCKQNEQLCCWHVLRVCDVVCASQVELLIWPAGHAMQSPDFCYASKASGVLWEGLHVHIPAHQELFMPLSAVDDKPIAAVAAVIEHRSSLTPEHAIVHKPPVAHSVFLRSPTVLPFPALSAGAPLWHKTCHAAPPPARHSTIGQQGTAVPPAAT